MRRQGRNLKYDKDMLEKALNEYANSDKTSKEVAQKYGITANVLLYHYNKRKEQEYNGAE